MAIPGFYFSRLEARGRGKATAILEFAKGLNVISGASDTGKSYLLQCLDFMTGASELPANIEEAAGYESLWLEIKTWGNNTFTLERSLQGGDLRLYDCGISNVADNAGEILKAKRATKTLRTVSAFLLEHCGLDNIELLAKKKDGTKRRLTFRGIAHLVIINEEQIYTKRSPVHGSGIITERTFEESLFKYLLTGVDDASRISPPAADKGDGSRKVRKEMLQEIIEATDGNLRQLTDSPDEIDDQLERIQRALEEATTAITLDRDRLRERQAQRKELWATVESATARSEVLGRLTDRFNLLDKYYTSDVSRLGAMSEAGAYLSQLPQSECPICGTDDPWGDDQDLNTVQRACAREVQRVQLLQEDLSSTMSDIQTEMGELTRAAQRARRSYDRVSQQIDEQLRPSEEVLKNELSQLLETQRRLERASALKDQLIRLKEQLDEHEQLDETESSSSPKSKSVTAAKTSETSAYCKVVETLLSEWEFPDTGRVTFSESNQDLVINGKDRSSHGKGIRALSYAAFTIALLRFCRKVDRPYPGFVVLDSPLVAYREPDSQEAVEEAGVKECFYRSLAKKRKGQQIIVFENEDPPKDIIDKINYIHFSGDKKGKTRTGFFPDTRRTRR